LVAKNLKTKNHGCFAWFLTLDFYPKPRYACRVIKKYLSDGSSILPFSTEKIKKKYLQKEIY